MTKVYAPPAEVGDLPGFDIHDIDGSITREEQWVETVKAWAKQHGNGATAGEEVRWSVADGYARYVVFTERPLALIHLPVGDSYQFQWVHRMKLSDIRQLVDREHKLAALFSKRSEVR